TQVDNADAIEITGNARVYVPGDGRVFVGSGEAPTITAFGVNDAGELRPSERVVSVANLGFVGAAPFGHAFVDADAALLFDEGVAKWNPTTMRLEGQEPLGDAALVGGRVPQAGVGVRRGDEIFVPVAYAPFPNIDDAVYVLVLDTSGRVLEVLRDDRCQQTGSLQLASDGTLYVSSDNGFVLPRFGTDLVSPSCILRIPPGERRFDNTWKIDVRQATGGDDATGFVLASDDVAYLFVLERDQVPSTVEDDPSQYYSSASSRWWRLDLGTSEAAPVAGMPYIASGSGISSRLSRRGTVLLAAPSAFPAADNRFYEVDAQGSATQRFSFVGRGQVFELNAADEGS
ncbi:MAG: hypothetical protein AAGI01_15150, partial [Myxococcota bacterium]